MSAPNINSTKYDPKEDIPKLDVEQTIKAAGDSEELIRRLVKENAHSKQIDDTINRNVNHLSLILSKKEIIDSKSPKLDGFKEAVDLGTKFLG